MRTSCRVLKIYFLLLFISIISYGSSNPISIAGIFERSDALERAFHFAVDHINSNRDSDAELVALTDRGAPAASGPFAAMNSTCAFLAAGAVAVFGPRAPGCVDAVQSVCDAKDVPHVLTRWSDREMRGGTLVNFYPHPGTLTQIYFAIVSSLNWNTFTVLYEDNESLLRTNELMELSTDFGIMVTIQQLDTSHTGNYRPILKKVMKTDQKFFVIDCQTKNLKDVLLQCQQVGMMTQDYNYFLTNLDAHTVDLMPFQFSETNITGIRLINPMNPFVQEISESYFGEEGKMMGPMVSAWKLETEAALIIDAVNMFSIVFSDLQSTNEITFESLDCNNLEYWKQGLSLINILKTSSYEGLTGHVTFDKEGHRSNFKLEIYEIMEGGITTVGFWDNDGINVTRSVEEDSIEDETSMRNKTFVVITALTDPYGMLKESSSLLVGNERLEGFGIDLIHELSLMEGFNYTFKIRKDKKNGKKEDDGHWSGMIGEVMYGLADLAITDLTITAEREDAVDFTSPFMNLGISILFRKPSKAPPSFFSFADPFALDTWIALAFAFLAVSFSFFILGRLCPSEWTNPYPCIEEPEFLVNQFSMGNSFWFATGSIMLQGSEIAPISVSTRLVAGVWWFFVLLITASYTANLASFLVSENKIDLFTDVDSLVSNYEEHGIKFGAKAGGATIAFFNGQKDNPTFQKIAAYMNQHPEDMVSDNKDGVLRAENPDPNERYAFFMESTSIEYETQRRCDLNMVGGLIDNKGYGIAMRKDSKYRTRLSTAILKLQSSGVIDDLKRKWWQERRGGGQCESNKDDAEATPLDIENVEGVFYVTVYGTVLAALLVCIEHLIHVTHISKKEKLKFREVFKEELKSYVNFNSPTKPVIKGASDAKSTLSKETLEDKEEGANHQEIGWVNNNIT